MPEIGVYKNTSEMKRMDWSHLKKPVVYSNNMTEAFPSAAVLMVYSINN